MTQPSQIFFQRVVESFRAPDETAAWVASLPLTRGQRWEALVLASILSAILTVVIEFLRSGVMAFPLGTAVYVTPMVAGIVTVSNAVITVFVVYWAGRAFGGQGGFADTISVMAWFQVLTACILAIQLILTLVAPGLLSIADVIALVALIWVFVQFVKALHGFQSGWMVFAGAMALSIGFLLVLVIFAGILGVSTGIGGVPNV